MTACSFAHTPALHEVDVQLTAAAIIRRQSQGVVRRGWAAITTLF
jgi:hypothetical protein